MATPLVYDYKSIPIYKRDEDFLMKALTYKQQKLDTNRLKLQNLYDQYSALKVAKDVDQNYINGRLEKVKSIADQYTSGDLSNDYLSQDLMGTLDQMVDDNVLNSIQSTKAIILENKEWKDAKDANDGSFSEGNRKYAQHISDLQGYLSSDEVGAKYSGRGGFIAFTDVNKLLDKHAQELAPLLKASYVESEDGGNGIFVDVTGNQIDRKKLEAGLRTIIGPQEQQQMDINSWNTYSEIDDAEFKSQFNSYHDASLEGLKQEREKQETFLNSSGITEDAKKATNTAIDNIDAELKKAKGGEYDNMIQKYDRPTLEKKLYSDRLMNGLLNTYSFNETSSIKVNESFKYANDLKFKAIEIEQAQERIEISKQANEINAKSSGKKLDAKGNVVETTPTTVGGQSVDLSDKVNIDNVYKLKQTVDKAQYDNVIGSLRGATDNTITNSEIQDFKKLIYSGSSLKVGSSVTLPSGKVIKIDDKLGAAVLSYSVTLSRNTEYDKVNQSSVKDVVDIASKVMEVDDDALFGGKYQSTGDGKYKFIKFSSVGEAKAYTQKLVGGKDLSDDDKFSKDMFTRAIYLKSAQGGDREGFVNEFTKVFKDKVHDTGGDFPLIMRTIRQSYEPGLYGHKTEAKITERAVPNSGEMYTYYRVTGDKDNEYDISKGIYKHVGSRSMIEKASTLSKNEDINAIIDNNDVRIEKIYKRGAMQNDPRAVVYNTSEKGQEKEDWNTLRDIIFVESDEIADKGTQISIVPIVKDGKVDEYLLKYKIKSGDDLVDGTETIVKGSELERNGIDINANSKPLINSKVSGQQVSIGKLNDFIGKDAVDSDEVDKIQGSLSTAIYSLKTQFKDSGLTDDYNKLESFQKKLLNGNITCKIATHGDGKMSADLYEDGKLLYSDSELIKADYLTAEELADPAYSFNILASTTKNYLNGPFKRSTEAYLEGKTAKSSNFGNQ